MMELEGELQKMIDEKCKESFAFIEQVKNHTTHTETIEERTDSANDDQSCAYGLDNSKLTANSGSSNGRNVNWLKDDID